jgi:hypothetical protein
MSNLAHIVMNVVLLPFAVGKDIYTLLNGRDIHAPIHMDGSEIKEV